MTLLPGCRFTVASKFHLEADWAVRLSIGTGVDVSNGRFFPRGPWRTLNAQDRDVLLVGNAPDTRSLSLPLLAAELPPPAGPTRDGAPDAINLFQIPGHLRDAWWDLLDATVESGGPMRGFDEFASRVSEFLAFKRLSLPANVRMEAIVTAAGERSIWRDPDTGESSGLSPTVAPGSSWPLNEEGAGPRLWGVVNLGDEPTGVVLVNLSLSDLAAELTRRAPTTPIPATVGDLVGRFLSACPDYPPIRLQLGPGEGCRLPTAGLVFDGDPSGMKEPAVLLLISEDGSAAHNPSSERPG